MKEIKFVAWFEEQHGKRPGVAEGTDTQLLEKMREGRRAEALMIRRADWDARFQSALYAWQALDDLRKCDFMEMERYVEHSATCSHAAGCSCGLNRLRKRLGLIEREGSATAQR